MSFEFLTEVKTSMLGLLGSAALWTCRNITSISKEHTSSSGLKTHFSTEDTDSTVLQNTSIYLQVHTVSQSRKPTIATYSYILHIYILMKASASVFTRYYHLRNNTLHEDNDPQLSVPLAWMCTSIPFSSWK
jgi:hypothetical protein